MLKTLQTVNYCVRIPKHMKKEIQTIRLKYDVKIVHVFYAMLKTCEKHSVDFEHYLWEAKKIFK